MVLVSGGVTADSALVLGTQGQTGLCIVRSLGRRGVRVVAGGPSPRSLGMLSRHSDDSYVHPDPRRDADAFVDHLVSAIPAQSVDLVFAPTDWLSVLLSRHGDAIESTGATLALEDWSTLRLVDDKARLFDRMADVDVPCPETRAPRSVREVAALAPEMSYPVVVKPRSKTLWVDGVHSRHLVDDANYAASPADLVTTFESMLAADPRLREHPPIVQAFVPGETTATVVLADGGEVRAHFQERRLRTAPASGGNSALLGAVDDPRMLTYAERVVAALDWTGPAQVEFMQRPDGEYELVEVNGRYWGSLPFAVRCGVDVPWLHYRQLRGERVSHDGDYRTDVVGRRMLEDGKWFLEQLSDRNLRAVGPFLADFVRADHLFVSASDPLPTLGAVVRGPRAALRVSRTQFSRATGADRATRAGGDDGPERDRRPSAQDGASGRPRNR
jgi:predicted ATP-grasp superfamily ATP-dependent carboligase